MKLLFLDLESQSLDQLTTNITEIGAILGNYSGLAEPFLEEERFSELVYSSTYPPQTQEIIEITGITDEMLKNEGRTTENVLKDFFPLIEKADYAIAHNAAFDRSILENVSSRLGMVLPKPKGGWLCTRMDIDWPKRFKCKQLSHLAYDHSILVPPKDLHRALNDVELLVRLVMEGKYAIEDMVEYRNSPWFYLRAQIPGPWVGNGGDGGVGRDQAKALGYSYEKIFGVENRVFPKQWIKRVKQKDVEQEKAKAPFQVMEIQ